MNKTATPLLVAICFWAGTAQTPQYNLGKRAAPERFTNETSPLRPMERDCLPATAMLKKGVTSTKPSARAVMAIGGRARRNILQSSENKARSRAKIRSSRWEDTALTLQRFGPHPRA